jgi:hypothetical protein
MKYLIAKRVTDPHPYDAAPTLSFWITLYSETFKKLIQKFAAPPGSARKIMPSSCLGSATLLETKV